MAEQYYISGSNIFPVEKLDRPLFFLIENVEYGSSNPDSHDSAYKKAWSEGLENKSPHEIAKYLENVYTGLCPLISAKLNLIHQLNHPTTFWEPLFGYWLSLFMHIVYDRFARLNVAKTVYGKDNIILLASDRKLIYPKQYSYALFAEENSLNDECVSSFYGDVAEKMGIATRRFSASKDKETLERKREPLQDTYINKFTKIILQLKYSHRKMHSLDKCGDVLIDNINFTRDDLVKIGGSLFTVFNDAKPQAVQMQNIDKSLLGDIEFKDEYEQVLVSLLADYMPGKILGEFNHHYLKAKKWENYKVYFSFFSWVSITPFCFAAVRGRLKGAKIVIFQHGGGYGQHKYMTSEHIERRIADYYVTWGWSDMQFPGARLVPLPVPILSRKTSAQFNRSNYALWVGTALMKYSYRINQLRPENIESYLGNKKLFLQGLDQDIKKHFFYRPYFEDYGLNHKETELFRTHPEVTYEIKGTIYEHLARAKLLVCDIQSTTILEAIAMNTPSIFFWSYEKHDERESSIEYFDSLRSAGILYHDPKEASLAVNRIWDDVDGWWSDPARQKARLHFMQNYCYVDDGFHQKWKDFFTGICAKHCNVSVSREILL